MPKRQLRNPWDHTGARHKPYAQMSDKEVAERLATAARREERASGSKRNSRQRGQV